jgi:integrase
MAEKKRRGHNEGSVYYDKDKDRWVAAVSIGLGKKRKKYYFEKKQDAIRKKNEALRELERGTLATGPQQKLGDYLSRWLEEVHKPTIRLSSYIKYRKLINTYIIPELGDVQVQKLTPQQVQSLYTRLGKRGLAPKTINSVHGVLHKALDNAVRWSLVSRNVCDLVSPPRVVKREMKPLTLEQAHKLLETAKGHRLEVLLMLAVVTGMRRGELLALRWSDVDLERHTLLVCRTVDYIAHYGYVETKPKTKSGMRQIMLPSFMVEILEAHRVQQAEQRQAVGDEWEELGLVFCDLHGGYINSRYLLVLFRNLLQEAGLPHMHFHDLRHSAVTLLMSMEVNIKVIQELLGHSDIITTLGTYGHLLPTMQGDAMNKWDDVFGGEQDRSEDEAGDDEEGSGGVLVKR